MSGESGFAAAIPVNSILTDPFVAAIFGVPILVGVVVIIGCRWPWMMSHLLLSVVALLVAWPVYEVGVGVISVWGDRPIVTITAPPLDDWKQKPLCRGETEYAFCYLLNDGSGCRYRPVRPCSN